jgi:hypothetical protein
VAAGGVTGVACAASNAAQYVELVGVEPTSASPFRRAVFGSVEAV